MQCEPFSRQFRALDCASRDRVLYVAKERRRRRRAIS
jgi:hypothetical protein